MKKENSCYKKFRVLGIGWKTKVSQKRSTFSVSINKLVAEGNCLEKGQELYSYLCEDSLGRKIIITYLDKKKIAGVSAGAKKNVLII